MYNAFPSKQLEAEATAVFLHEVLLLQEQYQTAGQWRLTAKAIFSEMLQDRAVYMLLYQHPVHAYLNRAYLVEGRELKPYLADHIHPNRRQGLDIWIMPPMRDWLIGCNHDGGIFSAGTAFSK